MRIDKSDSGLRIRRVALTLMSWVLLGMLAGCITVGSVGNVNHLYEAQRAFNDAAARENQMRMGGLDPFRDKEMRQLAENVIAVRSGYALALVSLGKVYPAEKDFLEENRLLGTTLSLRAMALWKTGEFEGALETADLAKKEAAGQLYPRDAAVVEALPGLIKTDLAYKRILEMEEKDPAARRKVLDEEIRPRLVGERGAVADLDRARREVHREHEANVYLLSAQMAAFRNYQRAYQLAHEGSDPPDSDPAKQAAGKNLGELQALVRVPGMGESVNELVEYWKTLCRINPQP